MNSPAEEVEGEVEKARDTLAMADRAIEISRKEQERISASLPPADPDPAAPAAPPAEAL